MAEALYRLCRCTRIVNDSDGMPYTTGTDVECGRCIGMGFVPVALVPTDRDALARVAFDAFYAEGTPYTEIEAAIFGQVVDAVLAKVMP